MPKVIATKSRDRSFKKVSKELSPASTGNRRSTADRRTARRMLELLHQGADVRHRKTRRIGAAIRAGKYENALKLDIAIDRLMGDL